MSDHPGVAAVHAFIDAFNALDHEALGASLNYPHVRLARGKFATVESKEVFVENSKKVEPQLLAEGWHHTVIANLEVLHATDNKAHIALVMDRCHEDGTVYNSFETLWIATLVDGHWGIQFRSSYL